MKRLGKVISFLNNKGGSGKTATTSVIGELLAALDYRVCLVDLDQQCNLSMLVKCFTENSPVSVKTIFKDSLSSKEEVMNCIQETDNLNIDIIASDREQALVPKILETKHNATIILKKALDTIKDEYDFILIDNAPASDILTTNSLLASDYVLCPAKCEIFSYEGIKTTLKNIINVQEQYMASNLKFLGVFLTAYEANTRTYQRLKKLYQEEFGSKFLPCIRKDIKICDMEYEYLPLLSYSSNANQDYARLLLALNIIGKKQKKILLEVLEEI